MGATQRWIERSVLRCALREHFPGVSAVSEGFLAFVFVANVTSAMNYYTFVKMKMLQEMEAVRGGAGIFKRCRSNGCKRSACPKNYG
mgnify:CR=1 FL=1